MVGLPGHAAAHEPPAGLPARDALAARVHGALPQTQCTRCGFADCAAYAQAIAAGEAPINQCPPGGADGIARLSIITGLPPQPLNPSHGIEGPRAVAVIDEAWCIGCTLCMEVCPTDAVLGSNKRMHTVIEPYCTGCELCIPVCPVDCISLVNVTGEQTGWSAWSEAQATEALARYDARRTRQPRAARDHAQAMEHKAQATLADLPGHTHGADGVEAERKKAVIAAALEKARARRGVAG